MMPLFMLLGHILLGTEISKRFHCLSLLWYQLFELLHFLMGCCVCRLLLTHLGVVRLVADGRGHTLGLLSEGHAGAPFASYPPPGQRVLDICLEVQRHEISADHRIDAVDCPSNRCTAITSARAKSSDCARVLAIKACACLPPAHLLWKRLYRQNLVSVA